MTDFDIKKNNEEKFLRANKFDIRLQRKVEKLKIEYENDLSNREAIQRIKENYRSGISGERLKQVFQGNSNKYQKGRGNQKIENKVLRRKNKQEEAILKNKEF